MKLKEYKKKRNFRKTAEPVGKTGSRDNQLHFVVQKHAARNLHYDFRLELNGVLKSWAVPKGPSLDPTIKRLAMHVEDHPYDYKDFEGVIPAGEYGAGQVIVWDSGTYHAPDTSDKKESEKLLNQSYEKGDMKFVLEGQKLKGGFVLVKMKNRGDKQWLLIKHKDEYASADDILSDDHSVLSDKTIDNIEAAGTKQNEKSKKTNLVKDINGVKKSKFPDRIKPMLAVLIDKPFNDKNWIFEIKWDGYRAIAEVEDGKVSLYSRNNISFTKKFSPIVESLKKIEHDVILDGEVVSVDDKGISKFQLLQEFQKTGNGNLLYYVFDIIYLDGYDIKKLPLIKRKDILRKILPSLPNVIYSDHIENDGEEFFKMAEKQNIEGILAKNKQSAYQLNKRSNDWLKIKIRKQQEAIIGGFTRPKGSRKNLGSLVLGVFKGNELVYIGHSGGGFTENSLAEIRKKLEPLARKSSPFKIIPKTNTPATWVEPKLVCEVSFSEWTNDGIMRQPIFLGLREDKKAGEVVKEEPNIQNESNGGGELVNNKSTEIELDNHRLNLTNLNKVYFPEDGYTKGDLIEYYKKASEYILPYLIDRPQSLNRHPNGMDGKNFFQKDLDFRIPSWLKTKNIYSESNNKEINYLICSGEDSLIYMVNLGCIEINPWLSRVKKLEYPDYLVIDLDPEEISFNKVIETALVVKEVLEEVEIEGFCKTSGATGIHIYVPLSGKYNYAIARDFTHVICQIVNSRIPEFTSLERSPSKRKKKVYLDYLQNGMGKTLAAPYSVRPKEGATVSTPLRWEELKPGLSPENFNINNIMPRLAKTKDLFKPVLGKGINIKQAMKKLEELQNK